MIPSKSLEDLIAAFETEITNAAETMPADRYRFNPACADEVTRVAQANYVVASNIVGGSPEVDLKMLGQLQTKKEILKALAESFIAVHEAVARMTAEHKNALIDGLGVGLNQSKISPAAWVQYVARTTIARWWNTFM